MKLKIERFLDKIFFLKKYYYPRQPIFPVCGVDAVFRPADGLRAVGWCGLQYHTIWLQTSRRPVSQSGGPGPDRQLQDSISVKLKIIIVIFTQFSPAATPAQTHTDPL